MFGQHPSPVFFDLDRDSVVARGVEVLEHRRRGCERHFVLAGTAAVDDPYSKFLHGNTKDTKETKDTEETKETEDTEETKETEDTKETKETEDTKDLKGKPGQNRTS